MTPPAPDGQPEPPSRLVDDDTLPPEQTGRDDTGENDTTTDEGLGIDGEDGSDNQEGVASAGGGMTGSMGSASRAGDIGARGGEASKIGIDQLSRFGGDLPTPASGPLRLERLAANSLLALLLSLLVLLPAELFNSTLRVNYDQVLAPFRRLRAVSTRFVTAAQRRVPGAHVLGAVGFVTLAALANSALDPQFGRGAGSLRLILAQSVALFATTFAACSIGLRLGRRFGVTGATKLRPGGLVLCFGVVLLSRAIGVSPGFLYGLVVGLQFNAPMAIDRVGRIALAQVGFLLTIGIGSWLALGPLHNAMEFPNPGFVPALGAEVLTAMAIGATTGLVLSLMPLTYLRGERLFVWNRRLWLATYTVVVFAFLCIAVNPVFGSLPTTDSLTIWLGLYALFGAGSVLFWLRYRNSEKRTAVERLTEAVPRI